MFGLNIEALNKKSEFDEVDTKELTFSDRVEEFKTFVELKTLVELILNASEMGIKDFGELYDNVTDGLSDDEVERLNFVMEQFLRYLKIPNSTIEDLIGDDEEISQAEFQNLAELLVDRIGEGDIDEFIAYALYNDKLPTDLETDDIQFDWAFYQDIEECKKGDPDGGTPKSENQVCKQGFKSGMQGYWRYPKENFPNGDYPLKKGGVRTHTKIKNFKDKNQHTSSADKERVKDNKKRLNLGLNVFAGYKPKRAKLAKKSQVVAG